MIEFNFKSQPATSIEQSERLIAFGLRKETADMRYYALYLSSVDKWYNKEYPEVLYDGERINNHDIPAWSLHRLIEMMPKCVRAHSSGDDSPRLHPYVPKFDYLGVTIENIDEILADFYQHTDLFDNLIDCIEWLVKEGYFNKEYLV